MANGVKEHHTTIKWYVKQVNGQYKICLHGTRRWLALGSSRRDRSVSMGLVLGWVGVKAR